MRNFARFDFGCAEHRVEEIATGRRGGLEMVSKLKSTKVGTCRHVKINARFLSSVLFGGNHSWSRVRRLIINSDLLKCIGQLDNLRRFVIFL